MEICLDCKKSTETVIDLRTGDTICTECSLVISDHYIRDCQEWRTFANDDNSDRDPNRVGDPTNPLLKSGGIGTIIETRKENTLSSVPKNNDIFGLSRAQNLVRNKEEDVFKKACNEIKRMTEDLDLIRGVEFRACEIVSKFDVDKSKKLRRGKQLTALCAASVSTACRELKLSRTLKEISTVANGVSLKDINKASMGIKRLLRSDQDEAVSDAPPQVILKTGELVRRFCSKLDLSEKERKAIREAVEMAENFDIRRTPKSVLAAIIFMICQLSQTKQRHISDIALASEVVENTIKKSANDMYPYASKIIPKWYASEEHIINKLGGNIGSWDGAKLTV
ncbi:plant-specific TFIIB-related protein 2-like isoform X2 [Brassica rapa]|uniref:TFIIB-type domain-containing protein n=1 Tax=Brassica campestris TaxID=3711 RepID=M4DN91_BRACM|nr:plant-specific TFIIB-related protein 2-like isoform X2 [Brassica rapa]